MYPNLGPILGLFLPGFVAMEIAFHLGPRNFRTNSEPYKYVIALLMGCIIFMLTSGLLLESLAIGWKQVSHPQEAGWPRIIATPLVTLAVGVFWHLTFSGLVPWVYDCTRRIKAGLLPHYHGPIKVFDQAMDEMDGVLLDVYLKDRRVLQGVMIGYPDLDGDSGIFLSVTKRGFLPADSWIPAWTDETPEGFEGKVYVTGSLVEYVLGSTKVPIESALQPNLELSQEEIKGIKERGGPLWARNLILEHLRSGGNLFAGDDGEVEGKNNA